MSMSSLQNLPAEVLSQICASLVPSSRTFLLNPRSPGNPIGESRVDAQVFPRIRGTPLLPEDESLPQSPAIVFSDWGVDIFTILLLHPKIYTRVVECLYSNNTFYSPDLATLLCLKESWSPLAISSVRSIRIDACGAVHRHVRGYTHSYSWGQLADLNIVRIPELFPRVREMRMDGIGPGAVYSRRFTYRGSNCIRVNEVNDVWTLNNIDLIKKVVGAGSMDGPSAVASESVMTKGHELSGGRVFCMQYSHSDSWSPSQGTYRLHGTRIIRRGEVVKLGSMEQEVLDIDATLQKARAAHEGCEALGYRELLLTNDPLLSWQE